MATKTKHTGAKKPRIKVVAGPPFADETMLDAEQAPAAPDAAPTATAPDAEAYTLTDAKPGNGPGTANAAREVPETPAETARIEKALRKAGAGKKAKKATRPSPEVPAKGARTNKAARVEAAHATPGSLTAVAEGYLATIQKNGRSEGTARSYRADLAVAFKYLGAATPVADLTEERVRGFFEDRKVTHTRAGKKKNPVTVAKTRRILRLALVWAATKGIIAKAPIPEMERAQAETTR